MKVEKRLETGRIGPDYMLWATEHRFNKQEKKVAL